MRKVVRLSGLMCIVIAVLMIITGTVYAASKTTDLHNGQMSITDSSGSGTGGESEYTITAKGNLFSKATNTITITNKTETNAKIAFAYSVSSANSFTIGGATASTNGNHSATVGTGESITIVLQSKSGFSDTTATLILTDITFTSEAKSSEITIEFDSSLGTVTVDGVDFASGDTITIEESGSKQLLATPVADASFIAWVDEDGNILSRDFAHTQESFGTMTIKALFSKDTSYFIVDDIYIFGDLNEAVSKGEKVVLFCDGVLPKGDYVIPAGVTLLIPFDDNNTIYTDKPESVNETYAKPSPYRTLTMEGGANITVNGAICVPAKQSSVQGSNGSPVGKYGLIDMKDGSTISVNSGGNLYVWGYITGSGKITAKSGATVYEDFQVRDWRGGNATLDMIDNDKRVFPMSQYYVQNIEVPLTLEAGAVENGYMSVYVTAVGIQGSSIPFIGTNGMFRISSGSVTKDYDEKTDRLIIDINNGKLDMSSLSISMKLSLIGTQTVNSDNYTLPINGNITLNVNSGSEVKISQDMALLPGGVINVYKGAKCIVESNSKVFIYDSENWGNYCSHQNKKIMAVNYSAGGQYTRTEADLLDAQVYVEGEVDASNGYVYVTESGANINGAEGGLVKLNSDVITIATYQATYNSDKTTSYNEIPVTTAKIKNADGTYVDPELIDCSSEYEYSDGEWTPIFNHTFVDFNCSVCGAEKIATKTKYSINGESIVINSSLILDVSDDTQIIIATYNSDMKLLESSYKTAATLEEITFSFADVAMIKVFAWDAANIMTPISIVEEIEL